jgi:hypothetical protein
MWMTRRYLRLASNRLFWKLGDPFVWPYSVEISVDGVPKVSIGEGVAHGACGGVFTVDAALNSQWRDHFERAEATWLLPYLRRLSDGEIVAEAELVEHFISLHGRPPESFVSEFG